MLYKNILSFGLEFVSKLHLFVRLASRIITRGYEIIIANAIIIEVES